jgi:large subunit ribosomal protein L22
MRYAKAVTKYVRISPYKARLAAGLIRGKSAEEAIWQLDCSRLKGGILLRKTLKSAIANAETTLDVKPSVLKVHEVKVDDGPTLKRGKSRSKGSVHPIKKRTSHFTIVLSCE